MTRLDREFFDPIWGVLEYGAISSEQRAAKTAQKIMKKLRDYCETFGSSSVYCGSEWMFQDDDAQVSALDLVAEILDDLSEYADPNEDEE